MPGDKTNKKWYLIPVIIIVLLVVFLLSKSKDHTIDLSLLYQQTGVIFQNKNIPSLTVWIAETPEEKSRGLAVRDSLPDNEGMLFLFDHPDIYPFWMKDMKFPIDIIWLNEDKEVVYIKHDARPKDFPETYNPGVPAQYVLETVSGWSKQHNLKYGDILAW